MRKAGIDKNGILRCRSCGSEELLAKSHERGKRTQHLKCEVCGERQRFREPKGHAMTPNASALTGSSAVHRTTAVDADRRGTEYASTPRHVDKADAGPLPPARIAWRRPDT
jgi:transcription elongation factor Elf1